jgi:hypothetical protein
LTNQQVSDRDPCREPAKDFDNTGSVNAVGHPRYWAEAAAYPFLICIIWFPLRLNSSMAGLFKLVGLESSTMQLRLTLTGALSNLLDGCRQHGSRN